MRRLVPLGAAVAVLLALAGIASHGRPLAGGRGGGPTATFFDYVATTLVLGGVLVLGIVIYALLTEPRGELRPRRGPLYLLNSLLLMAASAVLAWFILRTGFEERLRHVAEQFAQQQHPGRAQRNEPPGKHVRDPRLRWDEIALVLALVLGTVLVLVSRRTKAAPRSLLRLRRGEAVSLAIDESIDDLRADPDLRRAIIAAYARMERALARSGLPRRPAEAPFEYLERALRTLDTSAVAIEHLTNLFEWAKFSQHEPVPEMRDQAIDALLAVRDELARPAPEEAVPA